MSPKRYLELYTHIYNYCTHSNNQQNLTNPHHTKQLEFTGIELYNRIREYLQHHVHAVRDDASENEIDILKYYTEQWQHFQFSSKVLDGICAYLNRSFKKQAQEANSSFYEIRTDNVFEIYNLALYEWKIIFFGEKNKPDNINILTSKQSYRIIFRFDSQASYRKDTGNDPKGTSRGTDRI